MTRPLRDRENSKFDSQDRVKVSLEEDNTGTKDVKVTNTSSESIPVTLTNPGADSDLEVTVKNTTSDAIPVIIQNVDSNIDVEVSIPATVEINDTTPIDVNVTNTSVNTNATIQGTPNVNVTNAVDIDDATAIRVDVTNASLTASLSGTSDVNVTNSQLKTKNQLEYTASDITALGSSTNVTEWTSALADGVLTKEFVDSYQNEFEQITLYTHPNLGDGNKALKKITQYSTQNNGTILESVDYRVVDWDKDNQIKGSVSISAGAVTSPDPNLSVSIHTVVTTLTVTDNTLGGVTLSLSGTNASFYHLHEVETGTHSQTSLPFVQGRTYQIHAHSNFPTGDSYSHSLTVTATGDVFGVTASVNIATSGTISGAVSWANDEFVTDTASSADNSKKGNWATDSFTDNKGWFPSLEDNSSGAPSGIYSEVSDTSISFWFNTANWNASGSNMIWYQIYHDHAAPFGNTDTPRGYMCIYLASNYLYYHRSNRNYNVGGAWAGGHKYWQLSSLSTNTWYNFTLSIPQNSDTKLSVQNTLLYLDGSLFTTGSSYYFSGYNPDVVKVVRAGLGGTFLNYSSQIDGWTSNTASLTSKWDEVTTWSKKLTASEALELYNSGVPMDPSTHSASSNLERYIRCGDDSNDGTSLNDASGATDGFALTHWNNVDKTTDY